MVVRRIVGLPLSSEQPQRRMRLARWELIIGDTLEAARKDFLILLSPFKVQVTENIMDEKLDEVLCYFLLNYTQRKRYRSRLHNKHKFESFSRSISVGISS